MSLIKDFSEYVRAAFTGLWIQTHEDAVTLSGLSNFCREQRYLFALFDIAEGVTGSPEFAGAPDRPPSQFYAKEHANWKKSLTPFLRDISKILPSVNEELGFQFSATDGWIPRSPDMTPTERPFTMLIVVIRNGHFDGLVPAILHRQILQNLLVEGKSQDFRIAVTSHQISIPPELDRYFVVLRDELPDKDKLRDLARQIGDEKELPETEPEWAKLIEAASGLTTYEAENSYALSVIRKQKLEPESVWEVKSQTVKKKGLLEIYNGGDSFEKLGGMQNFKNFCTGMLTRVQTNPLAKPRGILLTGVQGAGKSQAIKCLGNAVGRKVLTLDMGALRSKFQGESEGNLREALQVADSMQPCILAVDEVEKALSGAGGGGETDGGVTDRIFGHFLTWLQDHESDVFVACTSNNISALPPEFTRAERFDGLFFVDLPSDIGRRAIWRIYLKAFFEPDSPEHAKLEAHVEMSDKWTGAEIRACCRIACMLGQSIADASQLVSVIAKVAPERVAAMRTWAEGRCLSVSKPGIYMIPADTKGRAAPAVTQPVKRKMVRVLPMGKPRHELDQESSR